MPARMAQRHAKKHAARAGIVQRRAFAREIRKRNQALGAGRDLFQAVEHGRVSVWAAGRLVCRLIEEYVVPIPAGQRAGIVRAALHAGYMGNNESTAPKPAVVDDMVAQADQIDRGPELHHHIALLQHAGRDGFRRGIIGASDHRRAFGKPVSRAASAVTPPTTSTVSQTRAS